MTREARLERLIVAVIEGGTTPRSRAADALWAHLSEWVPRWLLGVTAWPEWLPTTERADMATDACAHLVLRCSSRDVQIHGMAHDPTAWACTVLRNYVQGQLRKARRRHRPEDASAADAPCQRAHGANAPDRAVKEALALLEDEIVTTVRPRFAASLKHQFRCYLAHRVGIRSDQEAACRRERELLYQYRHRGKVAALKAYQRLQAKGLDPEFASALQALLGGASSGSRTRRGQLLDEESAEHTPPPALPANDKVIERGQETSSVAGGGFLAIRPNKLAALRGDFKQAVFLDKDRWEHFGSEERVPEALRILVSLAERSSRSAVA